jgi:hypothetical protein
VLVHAAGLERSHLLVDKEPQEFDLVFDVKADGFFNLIRAAQMLDCPLRTTVVFSSIAGRFGNAGQTDYSAANDLMCKLTSSLRATHPETKAIAIDWSPWAGMGMATRKSIPEMMRRAAIDMLDPQSAVPVVRREIIAQDTGGEVVIARSLGTLLEPRAPDDGLDLERANKQTKGFSALIDRLASLGSYRGYQLQVELDPQAEPFLHDHRLDGTPLLPAVMGIKGFADVASLIASQLGSARENFRITEFQDVHLDAPLKFYRNEPRTLDWNAIVMPQDAGLIVQATLESTRELSVGQEKQHTLHFSGQVHLRQHAKDVAHDLPTAAALEWNNKDIVTSDEIYDVYFHGPAFQVLDGVRGYGDRTVGRMSSELPPITAGGEQTVVWPRLIELCLQTAGVWEIGRTGTLALPASIGQIIFYGPAVDAPSHWGRHPLYAEVKPRSDPGGDFVFDARVLDEQGNVYLEVRDYRTVRLPERVDPQRAAAFRSIDVDI